MDLSGIPQFFWNVVWAGSVLVFVALLVAVLIHVDA